MINPIYQPRHKFILAVTRFVPAWHFSCLCTDFLGNAGFVRQNRLSKNQTKWRFDQDLSTYNFYMARGWESKSVEEQQAQALSSPGPAKPPLTPAEIAGARRKQGLMMSRHHVLQQLEAAKSPRHREILQIALAELDRQLAQLV